MKKTWWVFTALALGVLSSGVVKASLEGDRDRLEEARLMLTEIHGSPDKDIPQELWEKARCVVVIPSVKKAAFIVGGEYGKGVTSCHDPAQGWSAPSFTLLEKGSWGFQIGGETVDLILLVMNDSGMPKLLSDRVALGAEASIAGGPVGRDARAMTDAQLKAEMLSYSRAQGLFAGVSLTGGYLKPDRDENKEFYGRTISAREILIDRAVKAPPVAEPFLRALSRDLPRKESR